jgi:hypothetical protein
MKLFLDAFNETSVLEWLIMELIFSSETSLCESDASPNASGYLTGAYQEISGRGYVV